jgi:hypothetical protein
MKICTTSSGHFFNFLFAEGEKDEEMLSLANFVTWFSLLRAKMEKKWPDEDVQNSMADRMVHLGRGGL